MIGIIDYGIGNISSIRNMLDYLEIECRVITRPEQIAEVNKLILPGVGSFDNAMYNLKNQGWISPLNDGVIKKKMPILGICLGMQLMTNSSEEGSSSGLGWINAKTLKFKKTPGFRIPHMGWNTVKVKSKSRLLIGLSEMTYLRFYFVHSFYVSLENGSDEAMSTQYGYEFTSSFAKENIFGVQFHPEKSHKYGMKLLSNFSRL